MLPAHKTVEENKEAEYRLRKKCNKESYVAPTFRNKNKDLCTVPDFRACFSKSLAHDATGKPAKEEIKTLLCALINGTSLQDLHYAGTMKLINPSCLQSTNLVGMHKACVKLPGTPQLASPEAAADLVELYAMSLVRDVPFTEYASNAEIAHAVNDLNALSGYQGPKPVTTQNIFRGTGLGEEVGPYLSQFLWLPYKHGIADLQQVYRVYTPGVDFMQTWETALSVQNGVVKEKAPPRAIKRYLITLRDLVTYAHLDDSLQAGLNACLILNGLSCPTVKPQTPVHENLFVDLGGLDLYDLLCSAVRTSMLAAWYHKWTTLKIRPEAMAMLVQQVLTEGQDIELHPELLYSQVLQRVFAQQGNYLLSQAYPEGSPCHPSMPSGHATFWVPR